MARKVTLKVTKSVRKRRKALSTWGSEVSLKQFRTNGASFSRTSTKKYPETLNNSTVLIIKGIVAFKDYACDWPRTERRCISKVQ